MSGLDDVAAAVLAVGEPGRRAAGAVVGTLVQDEVRLGAAGWALRPGGGSPGVPMTTDVLLDLASVTKAVATTAVVARLVAAGRLDLDEPVAQHLPGLPSAVTAADLLSHRAGLAPWFPLYCRTADRESALDLAESLPAAVAPRTTTTYSDLGFVLLGRLVERVTGTGLADLFAELVARPLQLRRSGFGPVDPARAAASSDGDQVEHEMVSSGDPYPVDASVGDFTGWRQDVVRGSAADGNAAHALGGVSGHAGLFAPLEDVLRVGAALTHGDFLTADVRRRLVTPVDEGQALGLRRFRLLVGGEPVAAVGHPGFTGTWFAAALERPLVVALAATRLHGVRGDRRSLTPVDAFAAAVTSALRPAGAVR